MKLLKSKQITSNNTTLFVVVKKMLSKINLSSGLRKKYKQNFLSITVYTLNR